MIEKLKMIPYGLFDICLSSEQQLPVILYKVDNTYKTIFEGSYYGYLDKTRICLLHDITRTQYDIHSTKFLTTNLVRASKELEVERRLNGCYPNFKAVLVSHFLEYIKQEMFATVHFRFLVTCN